MTRKNAQTLVVVAAALAVGVAAWFADDLAGYWRAARPPAGYQGAGGGGDAAASPRVDPPSQAFVPPFDAPKMNNTELLAHYVKQVPLEKSPTLEDWQKLLDTLPKELLGAGGDARVTGVTLPLGRGHFVMAMCADLGGNLWIGTEGEGIFRYNPGKPAAEQWAQFTTKDGLGDDYGYAMACDQQGRVWVGHLNHGVSVFNGEKWQTYEVVGGLSRPDTLNGPLGERIFRIAVCPLQATVAGAPAFHDALADKDSPMAGSVWMASSAGLAIYFPATDTWSYVTRAEGLPSDQANAIAFDRDGTVYVGTQCDGIAIAGPQDRYATWKQVNAANPTPHAVDGKIVNVPVPVAAKGTGLPTDLINDVLVARDGTIYAATTLGLAWSTDKGNSWQYVRGADWGDKVQNRLGGAPQGWQPPTDVEHGGGILSEDYTTTLADDGEGNLLVGHRAAAGDILAPQATKKLESSANLFVTSLVPIPTTKCAFRGTYGEGMSIYSLDEEPHLRLLPKAEVPTLVLQLPTPAKAPSVENLQRLVEQSSRRPAGHAHIAFIAQDWTTQGDWVGRYGRQYSILCASNSPFDDVINSGGKYLVRPEIADAFKRVDSVRNWLEGTRSDHPSSLYNPFVGMRRQSEWDDHGESYSVNMEGPDLWIACKLPEGIYRVSLYFFAFREHEHAMTREFRDLVVEGEAEQGDANQYSTEVRLRLRNMDGGVYEQFLLAGGRSYRFRIIRNFSYNVILNGVFLDRLIGPPNVFDGGPLGCMGTIRYDPPAIPSQQVLSEPQRQVAALWVRSDDLNLLDVCARGLIRNRVLVYRSAVACDAPAELVNAWRWAIPLWTTNDRQAWMNTMNLGWRDFQRVNAGIRGGIRR